MESIGERWTTPPPPLPLQKGKEKKKGYNDPEGVSMLWRRHDLENFIMLFGELILKGPFTNTDLL